LGFPYERAFVETHEVGGKSLRFEVSLTALAPDSARGFERDPELVLTRGHVPEVELERDEHVVVVGELISVEKDAGYGVEAVETEDAPRASG
jgi:hypothetical protein